MYWRRYVSLGVACTFDVLLAGFYATITGRVVAHVRAGISHTRGCSDQDVPYVVIYYEYMICVSKTSGCSRLCAHAYLFSKCHCEVLTRFLLQLTQLTADQNKV